MGFVSVLSHLPLSHKIVMWLWILHTLSFAISFVVRRSGNNNINQGHTGTKRRISIRKAHRSINWIMVFFLLYILVIRAGLGWQLRTGLIGTYVLYLVLFSFLDFAFNCASGQHVGNAFHTKRLVYLSVRSVYLAIGWVAFFFIPQFFILFEFITPDSWISYQYENKLKDYRKVQVRTLDLDYENVYDYGNLSFTCDYATAIKTSAYRWQKTVALDECKKQVAVYDIKLLLFKKRVQVIDHPVYADTRLYYFTRDSFFVGNPYTDTNDNLTGDKNKRLCGIIIFKQEGETQYQTRPYILSQ